MASSTSKSASTQVLIKTNSLENNKNKKKLSRLSDSDDSESLDDSDNDRSKKKSNSAKSKNKQIKYSSDEEDEEEEEEGEEDNEDENHSDQRSEDESNSNQDSDVSYDDSDDTNDSDDNDTDDSNYSSDSNNDKSDDSDYEDLFRRSSRLKSKKKSKKKAAKSNKTTRTSNRTKKKQNSTKSSINRRSTNKKINYCEQTDDDNTDTDDMIYKYEDEECEEKSKSSSSLGLTQNNAKSEPDSNVETIEKVLKNRIGRVGAIGSKTAIYNVEEYGDPNSGLDVEKEKNACESQYLIKWEGWSHLHNTWESKESLLQQKVKGIKKLENYLRKEEEIRQSKIEAALSPEDQEYMDCQSEMLDNLLETHCLVERIIADNKSTTQTGTVDYLCKWQGLPYSECTWEDGELIKKRFAKLIEEYEKRQNVTTFPPVNVKSQKVLRVRPRFVALKEKPDYLGRSDQELKLRDYQLDGLNWLANSWCKQNGIILADEMGLGKTVQAISFISYVFNEHNLYGPFLIVIPLSTIQGWQREFQKWCPEVNFVIYLGDSNSRSMIQQYEWFHPVDNKKIKCNAILTTYEILLKDKAFFNSVSWAALVVDEAHRLKNEDSLLYRTLIKFDTNHRLLITGTPLQNSLKELWALLHFIMPEKFENWEEFDNKYSSVLTDGLRFQDLHKELQPYLLRRVKKDVEKSLPAKVEQILRVEMTKTQKQYYKLILTKNYKDLAKGSKGNVNSFLNIMMELKKCSNHAYLIRRDERPGENLDKLIKGSGKLFLLDKLLRRLKETGHRVLIFSQMVRMLDIIAEYLQFRRFPFQRLDGSIKGEIRRQALDHFNKEDSEDFCFLLSTRAGGLGINLSTADTVIIYDSDWNPQNDLQAQARAHRIGQKNQVNIYRLVSKNSIEEDIVERAKQKMVLDHLVIQRMDTTGRTVLNNLNIGGSSGSNPFTKEELNSILKFGAEELFKEKDSLAANEDEEKEKEEYDIDEILKRAETREESSSHLSASEELLSQFKVATFSTMEDEPILSLNQTNPTNSANEKCWDEIIPESEREKLQLEEENEKLKLIQFESRRNRTKQEKSKSNKRSSEDEEDEEDYGADSEENSSDDEHQKSSSSKSKSSKSKNKSLSSSEHFFKGLNAQEIRRFVRSYRKFPCPLMRIDTIAQDANLEEKSQACLIEFAKKMQSLCKSALNDQLAKQDKSDKNNSSKSREKGPIVIINGVKLYAQQILDSEKYFEPLSSFVLPSSNNLDIQFKTKLKQTYWDCEWTVEDDKALLKGIYEYGYGNWEWIKADPQLKLASKILISQETKPEGKEKQSETTKTDLIKLKPQSKHLRTRIDYLIKVLQNQINVEKYGPNWKSKLAQTEDNHKTSTSISRKHKNTESNNFESSSGSNSNQNNTNSNSTHPNHSSNSQLNKAKRKHKSNTNSNLNDSIDSDNNSETNSETKKKRNNSGEDSNHHHHHHHHHHHQNSMDHEDINSDQEQTDKHRSNKSKQNLANSKPDSKEKKIILSEKTFNECKNILRPVKKALKNIDVKETNLSEKEHLDKIKKHILEIGDKINDHLTIYSDPEKIKLWRNYLWVFVSKFTSSWNWEKIKNLYKKFSNSREVELFNTNPPIQQRYSSSSQNPSTSFNNQNNYNNNSHNKYHSNSSHNHNKKDYFSKSNNYDSNNYKSSRHFSKKEYSTPQMSSRREDWEHNSNYFTPQPSKHHYFANHHPYEFQHFNQNNNSPSFNHLAPFVNNFSGSNQNFSHRKPSFNRNLSPSSYHENPKKLRTHSIENYKEKEEFGIPTSSSSSYQSYSNQFSYSNKPKQNDLK